MKNDMLSTEFSLMWEMMGIIARKTLFKGTEQFSCAFG